MTRPVAIRPGGNGPSTIDSFSSRHALTGPRTCGRRCYVRVQVYDQKGWLLDGWRGVIVPWGFWVTAQDEICFRGSTPQPWRIDPKYPKAPLGCPPRDQVLMKFD